MEGLILADQILDKLKPMLDSKDYKTVEKVIIGKMKDYSVELKEPCYDLSTEVDYSVKNARIIQEFAEVKGLEVAKSTIKQYVRAIKNVALYHCNKPLNKITYVDMVEYMMELTDREVSNTSYNNELRYLNQFFIFMTEQAEYMKVNPLKKIKSKKADERIKKALTETEFETLISACTNQRDRALLHFMRSTGMRCDEVTNCHLEDVNFSDRSVLVRKAKGNKQRYTYLSSRAAYELKLYLNDRSSDSDMLFAPLRNNGKSGISNAGVTNVFNQLSEKTGIYVHPHKMRRTFATSMYLHNVPINEIKTMMGHANIETTMKYIEQSNDKTKNLALTVLG